MKKYKVTCLDCEQSDIIEVDELNHVVVDYQNKFNTNFQSFRWRADGQWGFYCQCGNDNRLANNEAQNFDRLVRGDEQSIKRIAESLLIDDQKQFLMEDA